MLRNTQQRQQAVWLLSFMTSVTVNVLHFRVKLYNGAAPRSFNVSEISKQT